MAGVSDGARPQPLVQGTELIELRPHLSSGPIRTLRVYKSLVAMELARQSAAPTARYSCGRGVPFPTGLVAAANRDGQRLTPGVLGFLGLREVLAGELAELGVGLGFGGRDDPQVQERSRAATGGEPAEASRLERREQRFLGKATAAHHALVAGGDGGRVTEDDIERADRITPRITSEVAQAQQIACETALSPVCHQETSNAGRFSVVSAPEAPLPNAQPALRIYRNHPEHLLGKP